MSIAVIGAGITGMLLAWRLLQQGHNVTIFEQDQSPVDGTSGAASAVSGGMMLRSLKDWDTFDRSAKEWPHLIAAVQEHSNTPIYYSECGGFKLFLSRNSKANPNYQPQKSAKTLHAKLKPHGAVLLDHNELVRQEPNLSDNVEYGVWCPWEATLDVQTFLYACDEALRELGATFHYGTPVITVRPQWLQTFEGDYAFDKIVVCAGVWCHKLIKMQRKPVPVRGQVVTSHVQPVPVNTILYLIDEHTYERPVVNDKFIIPRANYLHIGTTTEQHEWEPSTTQEGLISMLEYVDRTLTVDLPVTHHAAGLRPWVPGFFPYVKEALPGVIVATGGYKDGIVLAPHITNKALSLLTHDAGHSWNDVFQ